MKNRVLFFLLLVGMSLFSQELPNIVPPSPEARKMIEYGDVPISYSTGVPQVSVPLYSLPIRDIELPISMSYHASGVRVAEDGGKTGLKWSLSNGGGRISRTTMGRPDEDNFYLNSGWLHSAGNVDFENLTLEDKENIEHGCYDLQPDEFNVSLPNGFSGKFIFDKNAQVLMIPQTEDVKVEYTFNLNALSWTITDLSGIQYIFSTSETASVGSGCSAWDPQCRTFASFPTSWLLDRIVFPSGETVSYTYDNETYFEEKWTSQTYRKRKDQSTGQVQNCYNVTTYYNKVLTKIQFNNYLVEYAYSLKDANDQDGGVKLDNMVVKNGTAQIKKYKFLYEFNTVDRMFLTSIKEVSNLNKERTYRSFDYYDMDQLPAKNSFAIDHFGFRNSNSGNTVVPKDDDYVSSRIVLGANRLLDENRIKTGSLKNIYYPTKGWTHFEYEPNMAYRGVTIKEQESFGFSYAPLDTPLGWQTYYTDYFEVRNTDPFGHPANGKIEITNLIVTLFNEERDPDLNWERPTIDLLDESGNVIYNRILDQEGENVNAGVITFNVPSGNYRFKVNVYSSSSTISSPYSYSVRIRGTSTQERFINNQYYGGLRVKTITNFEKENVIASQRAFFYEDFEDATRSSGERHYQLSTNYDFNVPNYDRQTGCSLINSNAANDYDIVISSNPLFSEYALGSTVRYKNVSEVFVGDNEEYEIKRYFRDFGVAIEAQYLGSIGGERALLKPRSFENYALGILVKEEHFDKDKNLLQKVEYDYETLSPSSLGVDAAVAKATQSAFVGGGLLDGVLCEHKVNYTEYPIFTRWLVNKRTVNTSFYDNNRLITQSTENFFNNVAHKQLTKTETINSDGKKISTYTKYPQDISNPSPAIQKLISQHRIATPIEVRNTVKEGSSSEKQTAKTYNDYHIWEGEIVELQQISSSKQNNTVDDRIDYFDYDDRGNPLEVAKSGGSHIIYIWGYNKKYPIAKISNASYDGMPTAVKNKINQIQTDTNTEDSVAEENSIRNLFEDLRADAYFQDSEISSYTYDPLIGISSMTDPKGYTMYYHYDAYNRLSYIEDAEGFVVKKYEYNYEKEKEDTYGQLSATINVSAILINRASTITASVTSGSGNYTYSWQVNGQAVSGNLSSINYTFNASGSATVSCTINDETTGVTKTVSKTVTVYNVLNTPNVASNLTYALKGTQISFTTSNIGGGSGSRRYEWYVNNVKQSVTTSTFSYTPNTAGTYTVKFKVIDTRIGSHSSEKTKTVYAYNALNTPNVASNKTYVVRGSRIDFTASNIGGGSGYRRYEWYVNNVKQSATGSTFSYTPGTAGTYTVKFKVIDTRIGGHSREKTKTVYAHNPLSTPIVSANKTYIIEGGAINFTASSISGGSGYRRYEWYINDSKQSATGTSFTRTFSTDGTYVAKFRVIDSRTGQIVDGFKTVYVYNALNAGAISAPSPVTVNNTATFNINPSGGGGNYTYSWTVTGGWRTYTSTSKSFNLAMNYDFYGSVSVRCTVTANRTGVSKTVTRNITVNGAPALEGIIAIDDIIFYNTAQRFIFKVIRLNGSGQYTYKWYEDGALISSQPTAPVTLNCDNKTTPVVVRVDVTDVRTGFVRTHTISRTYTGNCGGGGGPGPQ